MDGPNTANTAAGAPEPRSFVYLLVTVAAATVLLWRLPGGNYLLYPFSVLGTWFHEMGHGLAAEALGGTLHEIVINSDGSGLAHYRYPADWSPWRKALVAAAGPLGPSVLGALLIPLSARRHGARIALLMLAAVMGYSTVFLIRGGFGPAVLAGATAFFAAVAVQRRPEPAQLLLMFTALQACISAYQKLDYVFAKEAAIGGQRHRSDVAAIAAELGLPHWFWGALIAAASGMLLAVVLRTMLTQRRETRNAVPPNHSAAE